MCAPFLPNKTKSWRENLTTTECTFKYSEVAKAYLANDPYSTQFIPIPSLRNTQRANSLILVSDLAVEHLRPEGTRHISRGKKSVKNRSGILVFHVFP